MFSILKHITFSIFLLLMGLFATGREGAKLYTAGNNLVWNQPNTWSTSVSGPGSSITPQSNDTLVIRNSVILNTDFVIFGYGRVEVTPTGNLKGNNFSLSLSGNSFLSCQGEIMISHLQIDGNSSLDIQAGGVLAVLEGFQNNSLVPVQVAGKLLVSGMLSCGDLVNQQASIIGSGIVSSSNFNGSGEIMTYSPCSSVPQGSLLTENNWTGINSADWNDPMNWTGSIIPTTQTNISILNSGHTLELSGSGFCHNLYLSPGSKLDLLPTSILTVDGNLSIDPAATLLLKSTSSQYASLLNKGTVSGKIRSEIHIDQNSNTLVSSPVAEAQSGVFINMYLHQFNESSNDWGNYIVPTDVQMTPMLGYGLYSAFPSTRYFEGMPNTGEFSQVVTADNEGWNLIGNPYPCYLDWQSDSKNVSGWSRNSINTAIYYPDPSGSGNYSVYIPGSDDASLNHGSRYIAPMQGFFVKARQNGAVQVNPSAFASSVSSDISLHSTALKFRVEGGGYSDEALIRFNSGSSVDFDDSYDAYKMTGAKDAPAIYSALSDGTQLAINTLPSVSSDLLVPVGMTCNNNAEYKLIVNGISNFEYRYPLTLEDRLTNTFVDLRSDSTYSFLSSPSSDPNRFILHFDVIAGTTEPLSSHPLITVVDGNIRLTGDNNHNTRVDVFGLDGRLIVHNVGTLSPAMTIPFQGNHGIYLVTITTNTATYAQKIYAD
ncbi:MAG: hypothetical protein HXX13_06515 [Bacteroidetes bacterium]|nr:hypothetical protein [Bacteroidota bacterium]